MSRRIFLYNKLAGHGRVHEAVEIIASHCETSIIINVTDEDAYDVFIPLLHRMME